MNWIWEPCDPLVREAEQAAMKCEFCGEFGHDPFDCRRRLADSLARRLVLVQGVRRPNLFAFLAWYLMGMMAGASLTALMFGLWR